MLASLSALVFIGGIANPRRAALAPNPGTSRSCRPNSCPVRTPLEHGGADLSESGANPASRSFPTSGQHDSRDYPVVDTEEKMNSITRSSGGSAGPGKLSSGYFRARRLGLALTLSLAFPGAGWAAPSIATQKARIKLAARTPAGWPKVLKAANTLDARALLVSLRAAKSHPSNQRKYFADRILVLETLALTGLALVEGPAANLGVSGCPAKLWPAPSQAASKAKPARANEATLRDHLAHQLLSNSTRLRERRLPNLSTPLPPAMDRELNNPKGAVRSILMGLPPTKDVRVLSQTQKCRLAAQSGLLYAVANAISTHPKHGVRRLAKTGQIVLNRRVLVVLAATTAAQVGGFGFASKEGREVQKAVRYACAPPRGGFVEDLPETLLHMCRAFGLLPQRGAATGASGRKAKRGRRRVVPSGRGSRQP